MGCRMVPGIVNILWVSKSSLQTDLEAEIKC